PETPRPAAAETDSVTYDGRVLGPDGKPVANAKLYLRSIAGSPWHRSSTPDRVTTGPDGRFTFAVSKAQFGNGFTYVAALADNHGAGWIEIPSGGTTHDLTLQLVDDGVPITGQIVDLQGRPVPGATLRVMQISAAPGEDLAPWLEAAKVKKDLSGNLEHRY